MATSAKLLSGGTPNGPFFYEVRSLEAHLETGYGMTVIGAIRNHDAARTKRPGSQSI